MHRKTIVAAALMVFVVFLMLPSVSASAEVNHDKQASTVSETITHIEDLPPEYYPYTQAKITMTATRSYTLMFNEVSDAKESTNINAKYFVEQTMKFEAWVWDDTHQNWVWVQQRSSSIKTIAGINELISTSEIQTCKTQYFSTQRTSVSGINPLTGEEIHLNSLTMDHLMIKLLNNESQFEKTWDFTKIPSS